MKKLVLIPLLLLTLIQSFGQVTSIIVRSQIATDIQNNSSRTITPAKVRSSMNRIVDLVDVKANIASPVFTGTVSGITKTMIGLPLVDNTADVSKPISTLQQVAFNQKLHTVATIATLQAFTDADKCEFDGSTWERKSGNVTSNGYDIINVSTSNYWQRIKPVKEVPVFVFIGESNSEGRADNSDATTAELAIRQNTYIWNVTNSVFEKLHIGVNSVWNDNIQFQTNKALWHGWELEIANRTLDRIGYTKAYIVKCGQGGSQVSDWDDITDSHFTKFVSRVQGAISQITNEGNIPKIYIFQSLGINDAISSTTAGSFTSSLTAFHANIRTFLGANTPIIMTNIMPTNASYISIDNAITAKADNVLTFNVSITGLALQDANHWSYAGMKGLANRMLDVALNTLGYSDGKSGLSVNSASGSNTWDLVGTENITKSTVSVTTIKPTSATTHWGSSPFRIASYNDPTRYGYGFFDATSNRFTIGAVESGVVNLDLQLGTGGGKVHTDNIINTTEIFSNSFRGSLLTLNQSALSGTDQNSALITFGNTVNSNMYGYLSFDASDGTSFLGSINNEIAHTNVVTAFMAGSKFGIGRKPTTNKFEVTGDSYFDGSVSIGTISANASSVLDLSSTAKGLLIPRMTQAQRDAISSPASWLQLICTDCTATDGSTGVLQIFNGTVWKNAY